MLSERLLSEGFRLQMSKKFATALALVTVSLPMSTMEGTGFFLLVSAFAVIFISDGGETGFHYILYRISQAAVEEVYLMLTILDTAELLTPCGRFLRKLFIIKTVCDTLRRSVIF